MSGGTANTAALGTEAIRLRKGLLRHFGLHGAYIDEALLQLGKVRLDIFRLDDWLHKRHGDYEARGMSMEEAVRRFYGERAVAFVKEWL